MIGNILSAKDLKTKKSVQKRIHSIHLSEISKLYQCKQFSNIAVTFDLRDWILWRFLVDNSQNLPQSQCFHWQKKGGGIGYSFHIAINTLRINFIGARSPWHHSPCAKMKQDIDSSWWRFFFMKQETCYAVKQASVMIFINRLCSRLENRPIVVGVVLAWLKLQQRLSRIISMKRCFTRMNSLRHQKRENWK